MMLEREIQPVLSPAPEQRPVAQKSRSIVNARVATLLTNARMLRAHGEQALSLGLLRMASNLDSKNPAVLRPLAEALTEAKRNHEAHAVRAAIAQIDYGFSAVFELAQSSYRLGRDEEALTSYYEALSLLTDESPQIFDIQKNMGNIFVRRGDFEAAEECYNKAHAIQPRSDVLMVNFGTLEVQRGDMGRAIEHFRSAIEINSSNHGAWTGLAMMHNEFGDFELAWGGLERALDLNPGNRTGIQLMGQWAMRDQTPQRAIPHVQKFMEDVQSDEEISLMLVNLFCAAGRMDLAVLETERVLAWNPGLTEVRRLQRQLQGEAA